MKTYVTNVVSGAEVVTPTSVNDEMLDIAGTANRLDDENFGTNALAASKLALGAMHRLAYVTSETTRSLDINGFSDGTTVGAVPDDSGVPWIQEVTTYGGMLVLSVRVAVSTFYYVDIPPVTAVPGTGNLWVGLRVDGQLVARSVEQSPSSTTDTLSARAHLPVGAGTHLVEVVFGVDRPTTGYGGAVGAEYAEFDDRALCVMEAIQ